MVAKNIRKSKFTKFLMLIISRTRLNFEKRRQINLATKVFSMAEKKLECLILWGSQKIWFFMKKCVHFDAFRFRASKVENSEREERTEAN